MVGFIMENLEAIASVTAVAAGIVIASWLGIWGDLTTSLMESGTTGIRAVGILLRILGLLSFPVVVLGAFPTALYLFGGNQGGRRGPRRGLGL